MKLVHTYSPKTGMILIVLLSLFVEIQSFVLPENAYSISRSRPILQPSSTFSSKIPRKTQCYIGRHRRQRRITELLISSGPNNNEEQQTLESFRETQTRLALVEAQLALSQGSSTALKEVFVIGQAKIPTSNSKKKNIRNTDRYQTCAVLSVKDVTNTNDDDNPIPALFLPLSNPSQLKLLSFVKVSRPLSKSVLLGLNSLFINRDGALFDNLPWSTWSIDPQKRNYDAAGNPIEAKYHLGKRDAYNRFMGKDWSGRSASIGNLALRLKYMVEERDEDKVQQVQQQKQEQQQQQQHDKQNEERNQQILDDDDSDSSTTTVSLAQRILELQIRELEMDLAEWDYQLAVATTSNDWDTIGSVESERQACENQLEEARRKLQSLFEQEIKSNNSEGSNKEGEEEVTSIIGTVLQDIADWTTKNGKNEAPYRGAIGYSPMLDSKKDIEGSNLPYTSPFDLLKEILDEQLNCEVIGAILENTSLLEGTLALGGALVLRRKTAQKTITIVGEELTVNDDDENYGNVGGQGGETMLVECDADEALAMAITCCVPIHLEPGIWDRASIMVASATTRSSNGNSSIYEALSLWKPLDPELSMLEEGQARNESITERASPLRIPRTTTSLFDSIFEPTPDNAPPGLFPTDNPIQSLTEYDELDNEGKARTLMSMSNFQGKLPRPRVLRQDKASGKAIDSLDEMLVPLIDESARRQFLMRDAELRGDTERLEDLRNEKTKRQVAREKVEEARARGDEEVAQWWESEAELYGDLRADVTQDEGAYSRFLDRDEWYERSRRQQAKKLSKKKFGTLLDGIE